MCIAEIQARQDLLTLDTLMRYPPSVLTMYVACVEALHESKQILLSVLPIHVATRSIHVSSCVAARVSEVCVCVLKDCY